MSVARAYEHATTYSRGRPWGEGGGSHSLDAIHLFTLKKKILFETVSVPWVLLEQKPEVAKLKGTECVTTGKWQSQNPK